MTTEHVSVPRDELECIHASIKAGMNDVLEDIDAILSRATPSDERITATNWPQPSAPRVVTDEDVMRACRAYNNPPGHTKPSGYATPHMMRAALESFATSLPAARVPEGFVLVPEIATAEMEKAGAAEYRHQSIHRIYEAMLDAAPQAEEKG